MNMHHALSLALLLSTPYIMPMDKSGYIPTMSSESESSDEEDRREREIFARTSQELDETDRALSGNKFNKSRRKKIKSRALKIALRKSTDSESPLPSPADRETAEFIANTPDIRTSTEQLPFPPSPPLEKVDDNNHDNRPIATISVDELNELIDKL